MEFIKWCARIGLFTIALLAMIVNTNLWVDLVYLTLYTAGMYAIDDRE